MAVPVRPIPLRIQIAADEYFARPVGNNALFVDGLGIVGFPNAFDTVFVDMDMPSVFEIKIQIMVFLAVMSVVVLGERR